MHVHMYIKNIYVDSRLIFIHYTLYYTTCILRCFLSKVCIHVFSLASLNKKMYSQHYHSYNKQQRTYTQLNNHPRFSFSVKVIKNNEHRSQSALFTWTTPPSLHSPSIPSPKLLVTVVCLEDALPPT